MEKKAEHEKKVYDYYVKASAAIDLIKDFERLQQIVKECPECVQYDDDGETLMHIAAEDGTPEMIEFLYHSGGDINKIYNELTPICGAVIFNKTDNVKMLIRLGAELDSEDSESNPLLYAVSTNYKGEQKPEIAKLLIDAGIDLTIQYATRDGIWWDALSFARYHNNEEIEKMILEKFEKDGIDYDSIVPLTEDDFEYAEEDGIDIEEHYEKYLGEIDTSYEDIDMQKEIYGDVRMKSGIDLYIDIIMPDEERDYITLITFGMGEDAMAETADGPKFAELMMKLPSDWDVSREALSDMTKNWPFRMLIKTAHLAHSFEGKYVDEGTVIPSGNPNDAILYFDGNTELSSVMLCKSEDIPPLKADDEAEVDFFTLVPVTEREAELVHKMGSEAVKKMLPKGEIVDMERGYLQ